MTFKHKWYKKVLTSLVALGILGSIFLVVAPTFEKNMSKTNASLNNKQTRDAIDGATYINVDEIYNQMEQLIDTSQYVYNVSQKEITRIVYRFIENPPPNLRVDQVIIDKSSPNNGWDVNGPEGTITASIKLQAHIDANGNILGGSSFTPVNIVFGKFRPAPGPTQLNGTQMAIGEQSTIPQDVYNNESLILNLIAQNNVVLNLPETAKVSIFNLKFSNSGGYISFGVVVDSYFDENNLFVNDNKTLTANYSFTGFRRLLETKFNPINLSGYEDVLASDIANNVSIIKQMIYDNVSNPGAMTINDINIIEIIANNELGQLEVAFSFSNANLEVSVSNTANSDGYDVIYVPTIQTYDGYYVINGFNQISSTTIPSQINLEEIYSNTLAQSITEDEIKNIILQNIENNTVGIDADNIKLDAITFNNLNGNITVTPQLDKFVDENVNLYDIPGEYISFPEVQINGFKQVESTSLTTTAFVGDSSIVASEALKNIDQIKTLISQKLVGKPDGFTNDNIIINKTEYDNLAGTITLSFTLNKYYDDVSGYLYEAPTFPQQLIIIRNYKPVTPTIIRKLITIDGVDQILASDYSTDQLIDYIKNNINQIVEPLPDGFDVNTNLKVSQINYHNIEANITAFIEINYFYNSKGEVVDYDTKYETITFSGFKPSVATSILNNITLNGVNHITASELNNDDLIDLIFDDSDPNNKTSPLIINFPPELTKEDIIVNIVSVNSNDSETYIIANISLTTYYNTEGFLIENSNVFLTRYDVQIHGFQASTPTEIKTTYQIPLSNPFSQQYASDIQAMNATANGNEYTLENLISQNIDSFFTNPPANLSIKNIVIKNVDAKVGKIIANIQILNYYNDSGILEKNYVKQATITINNFKPINTTDIASTHHILGVSDILATSYGPTQLKEIVWENKDFIFTNLPSKFNESNIIITLDNNSYQNTSGSIIAHITINCRFDELGQLQTLIPLTKTITFTGFKEVVPTSIVPVISINIPNIENIAPYDFSPQDLLDFIYDKRDTIFLNLPEEQFSKSDIYVNETSIIRNNRKGEIVINPISISTYYDHTGRLINNNGTLLNGSLTIRGFKSNNASTSISPTASVNYTDYANILPSDVTVNIIKDIVINRGIINIPSETFSILDIIIDDSNIIEKNNLTGEVKVNLQIKNYYDEEGMIINDNTNLLRQEVVISGFKTSQPTTTNDGVIVIPNVSSVIATNVDNNYLLKLVRDNYSSIFSQQTLPNSFSQINIVAVRIEDVDNKNGNVVLRITLNNFYNQNGDLVNNGLTNDYIVTISGFKTLISTTLVENNVNVNTNRLASSWTRTDIVDCIYENLSVLFGNSLPPNFNKNYISITNIDVNNIEGEITVDFELSYYIDDEGNIINVNNNNQLDPFKETIVISGFKKTSQTTINSTYTVRGNSAKILPSNIKQSDILDIIRSDSASFINNPVSVTSLSRDIIISNIEPNNLDGTVSFLLSLNRYYNDKGIEVSNARPLEQQVVIDGFMSQQSTIFYDSVELTTISDIGIPQIISKSQLTNIIYNNQGDFFDLLPNSFGKTSINVMNIDSYNNLDGTLVATLGITNYIDQQGILQTRNPYIYSVTIGGFDSIAPSSINGEVEINNFSVVNNNIPSYFYNNLSDLKRLIISNKYSIFNNLPTFVFDDNTLNTILNVQPTNFNNEKGSLTVKLTLTRYYNENGEYIYNNSTLVKEVKLTGLSTSLPTQILDSIVLSSSSSYASLTTIYPTDVEDDQIRTIIQSEWSNFIVSPPPNFSYSNITLISPIARNDINGTIEVSVTINYFYNANGEIVRNETKKGIVTISGFKTKGYTTFDQTVTETRPQGNVTTIVPISVELVGVNGVTTCSYNNILPTSIYHHYNKSDAAKREVDNFLYNIIIEKINGLTNTSQDNVKVSLIPGSVNDADGSLETKVTIFSYASANSNGAEVNSPIDFVVKIYGFKRDVSIINSKNQKLIICAIVIGSIAVIAVICICLFVFKFKVWRRV